MLVIVDSKKYEKLLGQIEMMYVFEEMSDQYDAGVRDGRNNAIADIKAALSSFWKDATT